MFRPAVNLQRVRIVLATLVVLAPSTPVHADWMFAAYLGASKTASNTVSIAPNTGGALRVGPIAYETDAFESPDHYGYRLAYFFPDAPWLGIGGEFTHNKATADIRQLVGINGSGPVPLSQVLGRLELTNGLNFALANIVLRRPAPAGSSTPRLSLLAFGGLGPAIPHVETIFAGEEKFEYQVTGPAWQVGGGAEWRIVSGLTAIADLRVTSGRHRLDMGTGILTGTFSSTQVDFGVGWHFGRAARASRPAP